MATGPEHYRAAEQLLTRAAAAETESALYLLRRAQVHAQLAATAAVVDVAMQWDGAIRNEDDWREVTTP